MHYQLHRIYSPTISLQLHQQQEENMSNLIQTIKNDISTIESTIIQLVQNHSFLSGKLQQAKDILEILVVEPGNVVDVIDAVEAAAPAVEAVIEAAKVL